MAKPKDTVTRLNEPNIELIFQTLYSIFGDRYGVEVKAVNIRKREDTEKQKDETA